MKKYIELPAAEPEQMVAEGAVSTCVNRNCNSLLCFSRAENMAGQERISWFRCPPARRPVESVVVWRLRNMIYSSMYRLEQLFVANERRAPR